MRRTRDRPQQAGNPVFDRELLKLHARAMINGATAIPLLVLVIGASGPFAGMGIQIPTWALLDGGLLWRACHRRAARRPGRSRRH